VHPSRIVIASGTALTAVAIVLPFVSSQATGAILGGWDAAWILIGMAPLLGAALLGERREGFSRPAAIITTAWAAVVTVAAVVKLLDAAGAVRSLQQIGVDASLGIGPWVMVAGAFAGIVGAALSSSRRLG